MTNARTNPSDLRHEARALGELRRARWRQLAEILHPLLAATETAFERALASERESVNKP